VGDPVDDEFDEEFGRKESKKQNRTQLIVDATEQIMSKYNFLTIEESDEIWYYKDGVYVTRGEILIAKELENIYGYELDTANLAQIIGHIKRRTYHKHEELDGDINIINLKNGLYNIDKDVLLPHDPNYFSINQKPITCIKDAKPQRFGGFLKEVLYARDIRTAVEAMAYTFHRDYIDETIFILLGFGANGKTVYSSTITALHGPDNVSNVPLSEMLGDRFALSDLENKDANIDNELAGQTIKETAVLKRLTGGSRQPIRIQRKNQRAYDALIHAKLFFNANKIPDSTDSSDAYNRRVTILTFPNRYEGEMADKQLIQKLTTDEELSGIFNALMTALRRIRKTQSIYVNEKTIEEKRTKYERAHHPIKALMNEVISEESTEEHYITKADFYIVYVLYCGKYSLPTEKYDSFCKSVKESRYDDGSQFVEFRKDLGDKYATGRTKLTYCWQGVRLTDDYAKLLLKSKGGSQQTLD
jgi:putative DNA primase/helicase